jgi:hypothetical protein
MRKDEQNRDRKADDVEWTMEEMVTEWFGPTDDLAGEPLQIERTANATVGQFKLTVFEFDRSTNGEAARVWLNVVARGVPIVDMNTEAGDFELSSLEAGNIAAVTKAGFRPADG